MWPSTMPRDASSMAQMTSSLTALALAPGVLNTGTPSSVIFCTGMLFTPAPQRTMQRTVCGTSSTLSWWLRSMMAMGDCGSLVSSPDTTYLPAGKRDRPTGEMALKVLTVKPGPVYAPAGAAAGAAAASLALVARSLAMDRAFSSSWISSSSAAPTRATGSMRRADTGAAGLSTWHGTERAGATATLALLVRGVAACIFAGLPC
mmetsp:Transcript_22884/g.58354  ORF Transcript_22884/g.58354 Transcript_22884/m.58354 type:complete len:204 (-) Transcript_22884:139-750(-)